MNGLTALQLEVARLLFGLAEADGFALAGGSALVALGVVDRATRDLDAFVATLEGESIEVDLAVDSPPLFPVESVDGIPTLAPQDLAARKVLAVLDRAEGRDFTDLWTLARRFGRASCIAWATQLDTGFADQQVALAFAQLARLDDEELPCPPGDRTAVREWFKQWGADLAAP